MTLSHLGSHRVEAFNTSKESENKIHDDAVVTAAESAAGLDLRIESHGELCITGCAALPAEPVIPPATFSEPPVPPPSQVTRPAADETTLAIGIRFAIETAGNNQAIRQRISAYCQRNGDALRK
jgi:hypothetical protein